MADFHVRPAEIDDYGRLAEMRQELWPDTTVEEQRSALSGQFANNRDAAGFPFTILVAIHTPSVELAGWIEVGLRSHADGCDPSHPAGYLEGWFVAEKWRRRGVGGMLVRAAEEWARSQGCREMASDTWQVNDGSIDAHRALGYEEVDRVVNFRKTL